MMAIYFISMSYKLTTYNIIKIEKIEKYGNVFHFNELQTKKKKEYEWELEEKEKNYIVGLICNITEIEKKRDGNNKDNKIWIDLGIITDE